MADHGPLDVEAFKRDIELELQQTESLLGQTVSTQTISSGDGMYFPIIAKNSGMNERSGDGEFPFDNPVHSRVKVELVEKAVKDQILYKDLQTSQVNAKEAAIKSQMAAVETEFDNAIMTALDATTETFSLAGSAVTAADVRGILAKLYGNYVSPSSPVYGVVSPAWFQQMMGFKEVASFDFNGNKLLTKAQQSFNWMGVTWIMHPSVPGVGTSSAKCFVYSSACVGHAAAANTRGTNVEHDGANLRYTVTSWLYHGAKVIQNGGVIEITHNDTTAQTAMAA